MGIQGKDFWDFFVLEAAKEIFPKFSSKRELRGRLLSNNHRALGSRVRNLRSVSSISRDGQNSVSRVETVGKKKKGRFVGEKSDDERINLNAVFAAPAR